MALSVSINRTDRHDETPVARETDTPLGQGNSQLTLQDDHVERPGLAVNETEANTVVVTRLGLKTRGGGATIFLTVARGTGDLITCELVVDEYFVGRARPAIEFDGHRFLTPGPHVVVNLPLGPFVEALRIGLKSPLPVTLGGIAGAGKEHHVARVFAAAKKASQLLMNGPTTFAVAPVRHDA